MNDPSPPLLHSMPIGIDATGTRRETHSMGGIDVPANRYWGAQTERSLMTSSRSVGPICRMPYR
jgi:fumarate hydratase class II